MPRIIAVSNRKGGTGKTTVAVNLAAELAALGRRVLLVDLDSQGHCAAGLGLKLDRDAPTAHSIFLDPLAKLSAAVYPSAFANLSLCPADQRFEHGSGVGGQGRLAEALAHQDIASAFDLVILDTPPSLDHLLFNALTAAHWVLVPYVPHHLSLEGVRQLMRVLFKIISGGANPQLKILGFVPTMSAAHIRQHRLVTGEVARQFGAPRVLAGIRSDIRLAEAFSVGKPVRSYAPKCRGAQDFANLAATLVPLLDGVDADSKNV
ncbi:ParA family protein [Thiorhodovibrio litoralis]|uniref:ParA family protein n=1 Tax=Thiorhodovibrio litoralis TaxID=2952932 RepID=UPI002B25E9A4|nr:ParA family protein [Thiorhodovibrio litoralis]WPL12387.1 Sporulation initiation inhibitor protein soj [Thiorhodovibrio litoralis]